MCVCVCVHNVNLFRYNVLYIHYNIPNQKKKNIYICEYLRKEEIKKKGTEDKEKEL